MKGENKMAAKLCPECSGCGEIDIPFLGSDVFSPFWSVMWVKCSACNGLGYIKI